MSTTSKVPPPVPAPTCGDLLLAVQALGWPALPWGDDTIRGEADWRRVVELVADDPALRAKLWHELGARPRDGEDA